MDSLRIDFAPRPRVAVSAVGALLLLVALMVVTLVLSLGASQDERHQKAMERHEQAAKHARLTSAPSGAGDPINLAAVKEASAVLDALSVPWDELFLSIESTNVEGMGLLTLSPDPRSGNLHISGEGASLDDVLAYVARLTSQAAFRDVNLVSYETVQRDGQNAVQFSVVAKWK
jgi:Tfp pilus assembly protein PilN